MPAPFAPTTPTRSPWSTVSSTSASTTSSPNCTPTWRRSKTRCPAALVRVQPQPDLAALEHGPLDLLHPVDLPLLVARLLDVALVDDAVRPVLEAPDRRLQPLDLLLLRHVRLLLARQLELAGERVGGVVARPHAHAAAVERGDLADRLVEQVAVVRDDDRRAVEARDETLEQRAADGVEMRLRLVEQEHVRLLREAGGERDQLPLAARERARRQRELGLLEADVEQHGAGAPVEARPAGRLPALDQLLLRAQHARHPVEVGGELGRAELLPRRGAARGRARRGPGGQRARPRAACARRRADAAAGTRP